MALGRKDEILDGLNDPNIPKTVVARKEEAMVRDLDDWKLFQETKIKAKAGEHRELLGRIFKYSSDNFDVLMKRYSDHQLRQRICLKEFTKQIFEYEKEKNDIVLEVLDLEEKKLFTETVTFNDDMNRDRASLIKLIKQNEELEVVSAAHREKMSIAFNEMEKRKTVLRDTGKINKLKFLANQKNSAVRLKKEEGVDGEKRIPKYPKPSFERHKTKEFAEVGQIPVYNVKGEVYFEGDEKRTEGLKADQSLDDGGSSTLRGFEEDGEDFYEMDRSYKRQKCIYIECQKAIYSNKMFIRVPEAYKRYGSEDHRA
jgi:hypothetical protein